uniref:Uncharacterized protein n=1 Tax=Aegilops tauschii subsp. strangulata TaxID=200361 RepID=A0A453SLZ6_AEGTS
MGRFQSWLHEHYLARWLANCQLLHIIQGSKPHILDIEQKMETSVFHPPTPLLLFFHVVPSLIWMPCHTKPSNTECGGRNTCHVRPNHAQILPFPGM